MEQQITKLNTKTITWKQPTTNDKEKNVAQTFACLYLYFGMWELQMTFSYTQQLCNATITLISFLKTFLGFKPNIIGLTNHLRCST
jgi:predicted RNA polymerase sigma factor